jgi:L-seryl-tRNA(Ser) seleniumtransferase
MLRWSRTEIELPFLYPTPENGTPYHRPPLHVLFLTTMTRPFSRRNMLGTTAALAVTPSPLRAGPRDYLKELGVRPIINGAGVYTFTTASLMRPEVMEAMRALSTRFVRLDELHDAVGKRIAELLGAPAAMVPSGAAAGLTVGTAGVLTGEDPDRIRRIPDLTGMKSEVVVQKSHRFPYDHMVRNCGVRLIEVETREELERAIRPQTAMLLFLNKAQNTGKIGMEEFTALGKKHAIPTMNDCAADVPPAENLLRPIRLGFDLVVVSGGKAIRGPQSAGILAGRADLIRAARKNTSPNSDTIGRSCKVNKEEMVGMMVALESFLKEDYASIYRMWERTAESMKAAFTEIPGVQAEIFVPQIANQCPHVRVRWSGSSLSSEQAMQKLRDGEPSIELVPAPAESGTLEIATWMLQAGDAEKITRRVHDVLTKGA